MNTNLCFLLLASISVSIGAEDAACNKCINYATKALKQTDAVTSDQLKVIANALCPSLKPDDKKVAACTEFVTAELLDIAKKALQEKDQEYQKMQCSVSGMCKGGVRCEDVINREDLGASMYLCKNAKSKDNCEAYAQASVVLMKKYLPGSTKERCDMVRKVMEQMIDQMNVK